MDSYKFYFNRVHDNLVLNPSYNKSIMIELEGKHTHVFFKVVQTVLISGKGCYYNKGSASAHNSHIIRFGANNILREWMAAIGTDQSAWSFRHPAYLKIADVLTSSFKLFYQLLFRIDGYF